MREIKDILRHGENNARTARECADALNMDVRKFQAAVAAARIDGYPILSSGVGFYLPGDDAEVTRFVKQMKSRAREILKAARGVERGRPV